MVSTIINSNVMRRQAGGAALADARGHATFASMTARLACAGSTRATCLRAMSIYSSTHQRSRGRRSVVAVAAIEAQDLKTWFLER